MRNRFCLGKLVNKRKRRFFSWNHTHFLRVCVIAIISISIKGQCSNGDMFSNNSTHSNFSLPSDDSELTVLSNSLAINSTESSENNSTVTAAGSAIKDDGQELEIEAQSNETMTDSSNMESVENELLPETDYEILQITPSPDLAEKGSIESSEDIDEPRGVVAMPESTSEMESLYDEEETSSKPIIADSAYDDEDETEISAVTPKPSIGEPKYIKPISSIKAETSTVTASSTTGRTRTKYFLLKKVPSRLIASLTSTSTTSTSTTTQRPKKTVRSTTKKPLKKVTTKGTKAPRPVTPVPEHHPPDRDPHHPHGVVVFDKRKKRPKPGHIKTKPTSTTTTTTATTTATATTTTSTTTTTLSPVQPDYYDFYWGGGSGESSEYNEINGGNSTNKNNSTSNKNRIPLSKLAMAMIASSSVFENGTGSGDEDVFYAKTPTNLLNILQSYTKQLQETTGESTVKQPAVVQLQSTPFMLQLSQLPFGTRVAISVYYSLIAIIPLVYLAFGGLGRLGFLNAFTGRGFGFGGRRRRRRSYGSDQYNYGLNDRYQTTVVQRADLGERNDDEYMWILGRISEIILEFSLRLDDKEN